MFPHEVSQMKVAAEHLAALLPPAARDEVSVSTYRRPNDIVLVVVLPTRLSYMRERLPATVDGIPVIYQISDSLMLN